MKKFSLALLLTVFSTANIFALNAFALSRDELKIGITQEFENLNPVIMQMMATTYMYNMTNRSLSTMNADGKWIPLLAKSIPSIENKQAKIVTIDGKKTIQATWEIRDNATWGDGVPVTCEDIKFTRDLVDNENISVGSKDAYTEIAKVEWDPKTPKKCLFTYDKLRWDFFQLGSTYILPKHLEEGPLKEFGNKKEGYETNSNYTKNPTNPGLYCGPYKISEVKLGDHVTFVPNPTFYGPAPKFKKIIVKLIQNTNSLESNLLSGTIDMVSILGFSFDQALSFEKTVKAQSLPYNVIFKPSLSYEHIDLKMENPIFKDINVRKALVYAIDREELVKALFEAKQKAAISDLATIDPWYTADPTKLVLYPHSKPKAEKLLDDAGWKKGPDGYRYKDGQKLAFVLSTTAGDKIRETVETFLKSQWKASGVDVSIKNEPARVFFGETLKKRTFTGAMMYAWSSSPESTPRSLFHSSQIPTEKNGWSGQDVPGWSNPKVDALIDKLDLEFSAAKRKDLSNQIRKFYTDEVPVIPLYYRAEIAAVPTNLLNYRATGHQFYDTNEVETWDVK